MGRLELVTSSSSDESLDGDELERRDRKTRNLDDELRGLKEEADQNAGLSGFEALANAASHPSGEEEVWEDENLHEWTGTGFALRSAKTNPPSPAGPPEVQRGKRLRPDYVLRQRKRSRPSEVSQQPAERKEDSSDSDSSVSEEETDTEEEDTYFEELMDDENESNPSGHRGRDEGSFSDSEKSQASDQRLRKRNRHRRTDGKEVNDYVKLLNQQRVTVLGSIPLEEEDFVQWITSFLQANAAIEVPRHLRIRVLRRFFHGQARKDWQSFGIETSHSLAQATSRMLNQTFPNSDRPGVLAQEILNLPGEATAQLAIRRMNHLLSSYKQAARGRKGWWMIPDALVKRSLFHALPPAIRNSGHCFRDHVTSTAMMQAALKEERLQSQRANFVQPERGQGGSSRPFP